MTANDLLNAVAALERADGVIGFPTDTVYGLGCKIDRPEAIERIYRLKGRADNKPLILLGKDREAFEPYISCLPPSAQELMSWYWPGPMTIVLPKTDRVPDDVTRGFPTVGLRIPKCDLFLDLLSMVSGGVLATTSANLAGESPCLTAWEVQRTFGEDLDFLLADDTAILEKQASTVVAVEPDGIVRVLRTGSIVLE